MACCVGIFTFQAETRSASQETHSAQFLTKGAEYPRLSDGAHLDQSQNLEKNHGWMSCKLSVPRQIKCDFLFEHVLPLLKQIPGMNITSVYSL